MEESDRARIRLCVVGAAFDSIDLERRAIEFPVSAMAMVITFVGILSAPFSSTWYT